MLGSVAAEYRLGGCGGGTVGPGVWLGAERGGGFTSIGLGEGKGPWPKAGGDVSDTTKT